MKRDIEKLSKEYFDILIIGGGIYGASIAREACIRGFKTALIEMKDFGNATSFNSMKIIHGGLRYLQHGNFKRISQSIRSRKIMNDVAPHLIKSVPFLIPTYGYGIKSRTVLNIGIKFYGFLNFISHNKKSKKKIIPKGKTISREDILKILPGINRHKLSGGAIWYEAVVQDTERLLMEFLINADQYDLTCSNYTKAIGFIIEKKKIKNVLTKDLTTKKEFPIKAKVVVNAGGPWQNEIQRLIPENENIELVKAVNIIVKKKLFEPYSVGLEGIRNFYDSDSLIGRKKRLYFFVPIKDYTMIGTSYKKFEEKIDEFKVTEDDIWELINEANFLYPSLNLLRSDVSFYHSGLLPMKNNSELNNAQPEKESAIYNHENKADNFFSVKSVKYTTAPVLAEEMLKNINKKIAPFYKDSGKSRQENYNISLPEDLMDHFKNKYGRNYYKILNLIKEDQKYLRLISDDPLVYEAEVIHAIRNEMALTLEDIVLRRTGMGSLKLPSKESIAKTAAIMKDEFGWDKEKEITEIEKLLKIYTPIKN